MRSKTMSQCSDVIATPWGRVDIVRISKAMSQCSGAIVTPWGKVDIAKDQQLWISAVKSLRLHGAK